MNAQDLEQRAADALPDGSLSKSTAKRVSALRAADEQRARELLAAGYERERCPKSARAVRNNDAVEVDTDIAISVIADILRLQPAPVDLEQFRQAALAFMQKASNGMNLHANPATEFERECYEAAAADFDEAQRLLSIIDNAGKVEVLARGWFHRLPDGDYDIRDEASGAGKDCDGCIPCLIVAQDGAHQPAPVVDEVERTLRDALEYVGQRTDGNLKTLAERAELWMRESKCLIGSRPALVADSGNWIAADDVRRLTREIDVALNGEAGAAPQASLCDIAAQVKAEAGKRGTHLLAASAVSDASMARALEWVRALAKRNIHARDHLPAIEEAIAAYDPNCGARTVRVGDDALADTQRAIIEAAERRGYERAKAEAVVVDGVMVERALLALRNREYDLLGLSTTPDNGVRRDCIRAALTAALARAQGVQS